MIVQYRETEKFNYWLELYLDYDNRYGLNTYHNQAQSAIHAYNLDPVNQYNWACVLGSRNLKKAKVLIVKYADLHGFTYGRLLDLYIIFMLMNLDVNMLYALASEAGIDLPPYKQVTNRKERSPRLSLKLDLLSEEQLQRFIDMTYAYMFSDTEEEKHIHLAMRYIYKQVRKMKSTKKMVQKGNMSEDFISNARKILYSFSSDGLINPLSIFP